MILGFATVLFFAGQPSPAAANQPSKIIPVIVKANRIIEKANIDPAYWRPPTNPQPKPPGTPNPAETHEACMQTIEQSAVLEGPFRVTILVQSIEDAPNDGKLIRGKLVRGTRPIADFKTATERNEIASRKRSIKNKRDDYRRSQPIGPFTVEGRKRELKSLRRRLAAANRTINDKAAARRAYLETVTVDLPLGIWWTTQLDFAKLASARHIAIVVKVKEFAIRAPHPDLPDPPAIGSLTCELVSIGDEFHAHSAPTAASP